MSFDNKTKSDISIEILAPAGNLESLKAAVNCGADAVYIGGERFSARKNAQNFTDDEIIQAVNYAHVRGAKVHVAVNTLMHEGELEDVFKYLEFLYNAGCDAVIIQDLGVLDIAKEYFKDMELHASTQMTVHNLDGAVKAKEMGFKRVVLSRELSFDEIKYITQNCGIETEVFAHGALCMCYSGQCLLSSMLGSRSGNRGYCAQPCRLEYTLLDSFKKPLSEQGKYLLSLKDMCLADEIKKLQDAGVASLKIEGRMKGAMYSALTSYVYNKAKLNGFCGEEDIKLLENIFSRNGFTKGYFNSSYGRDMLNYSSNCDDIYKNQSSEVLNFAENLIKTKEIKRPVQCVFTAKLDEPLTLDLKSDEHKINAVSEICPQTALKTPTTVERISDQLEKTGGLPFEFSSLEIISDEGINVPIKAINELRRDAFKKLEESFVTQRQIKCEYSYKKSACMANIPEYTCEVLSYEQAKVAKECGFSRIYIPYSVYIEDKQYFDKFNDLFWLLKDSIERDKYKIDDNIGLNNICISNISQLTENKNMHANYTMNIFNSRAQILLEQTGVKSVCLSPELNLSQIKDCACNIPFEIIAYGRIKLMTVQNCIVKSALGKCMNKCGASHYLLKDRKNMYFPVFTQKGQCTNTIYNSLPVYMGDRVSELKRTGASYLRFIFTTETADEIKQIVNMYNNGEKYFNKDYTRGHFSRGVF